MNQSLDMTSPDVLLGLVKQLIGEYYERTERGETFDMQPIERGIEAFCSRLAGLPKTEAARFEHSLEELMRDLTSLGQLMQSKQAELAESLRGTATMKKANKAYQTSDSFGVPGMQKIAPDTPASEE